MQKLVVGHLHRRIFQVYLYRLSASDCMFSCSFSDLGSIQDRQSDGRDREQREWMLLRKVSLDSVDVLKLGVFLVGFAINDCAVYQVGKQSPKRELCPVQAYDLGKENNEHVFLGINEKARVGQATP